jgi:hypothetical protein
MDGVEVVLANDISTDTEEMVLEKSRRVNLRSWKFWIPLLSLSINLSNATLGAGVLGRGFREPEEKEKPRKKDKKKRNKNKKEAHLP